MPAIGDGTIVCEHVKAHNQLMPVILITGNREDEGTAKYFKGFNCVIDKPISIEFLLQEVRKHKLS
jgi:CheY-like chemotaxis protein